LAIRYRDDRLERSFGGPNDGDLAEYAAASKRLWIDPGSVARALYVAPNGMLDLTSERSAVSAIRPLWRRTDNVDVFKSWVGTPDEECPPGSTAAEYWPLPAAAWSGRAFCSDELSARERADIEMAGRAYVFGNSSCVTSYRDAIQRVTGTFEVAIYAARSVRIASGGQLRVTGEPAVLLFEELEIADGGSLLVQTVCRAAIGRLSKTGT
jgi:hypothetical protein